MPSRSCAIARGSPARADGTLTFEGTATAVSDFTTNRTGFVVLHPIEGVAGAPVEVLHTDGRRVRARFPELIDPMCPFQDIRALTHEVLPGVSVTCTMQGDAYEMEDHRNWTDASYKTYIRPLAKPWPYTLAAGETSRAVGDAQHRRPCARGRARRAAAPVRLTVGGAAGVMPELGLSLRPEHAHLTLQATDLVKRARRRSSWSARSIRASPTATTARPPSASRPSRSTGGSPSAAGCWPTIGRSARRPGRRWCSRR